MRSLFICDNAVPSPTYPAVVKTLQNWFEKFYADKSVAGEGRIAFPMIYAMAMGHSFAIAADIGLSTDDWLPTLSGRYYPSTLGYERQLWPEIAELVKFQIPGFEKLAVEKPYANYPSGIDSYNREAMADLGYEIPYGLSPCDYLK